MEAPTVDIYCVNLQQIVYRGARTIFKGDAEVDPARTWVQQIPSYLAKANPQCKDRYICVVQHARYSTLTALFVREPLVKDVRGSVGPAVNIATGLGGHRCSKRGSVAINFKVRDSCFRVINVHIKRTSFADRLRDLSKILEQN